MRGIDRADTLTVRFTGFERPENEALAKELYKRASFALPSWLKVLEITSSNSNDGDTIAQVSVGSQYRQACVVLHNQFFTLDKEAQFQTLLHEFVRILNGRLTELIDELDDENWTYFNEQAVEDTACLLRDLERRFYEQKPLVHGMRNDL